MSPSARHRESRDGSLGNVKTPEGTGKYVEYAIETNRYLRLIARYGYIVTMAVGIYRRMPETVPQYFDEGSMRGALACASARAVSFDSVADCITFSASAADCTCSCANSRASACASTVSFAPTDEAMPALEECNQVMTQIATLAIDLADLAKQEPTELPHAGVAHGPM